MKKIINNPQNFVTETIEGILLAYGDRLRAVDEDKRVLVNNRPGKNGRVGIVTAGGSGHLPVFLGYVGDGMLDGCVVGNVFASPSAKKMLEAIKAVDNGQGVLCLYGNYGGDKMNFNLACENADFDDIMTRQVLVRDDVASYPKDGQENRRGVAGLVFAYKIAGAAADELLPLEEVAQITEDALANIRTMGFALSSCIVPEVGKPTFKVAADQLELGMGIHGEPGIETHAMMEADAIVDTVMQKLLADMPLESGQEVAVMVNGLGATPLEELMIVYRRVHKILTAQNISIFMPHIGEFSTSMEMAGCSITLFKLTEQFKKYLRTPASTPFYTNENK